MGEGYFADIILNNNKDKITEILRFFGHDCFPTVGFLD